MGRHTLATIVALSEDNEDAGHKVAMQVAAMKPIALDEASVPQSVKDEELKVAVQKTKEELIEKYVNNLLKKAGINPNLVDSADHIESNQAKGWLTAEDAEKAKKIIAENSNEEAAHIKDQMVQGIARGRMGKFFKDNCLVDQEFQFADEGKVSVQDWLKQQSKDLKVLDYRRYTLAAE